MKRILSLALLAGAAAFVAAGCSSSNPSVDAKVTLDGATVEGATVTFISEGAEPVTAFAITDSSGIAKLSTGTKAGVPKGKYKVTVVKLELPNIAPGGPGENPNMAEMMKKGANIKDGKPMGLGQGGAGAVAQKNLLPAKYGDASQTPFTGIEVPTKGQVPLDLKSDGK